MTFFKRQQNAPHHKQRNQFHQPLGEKKDLGGKTAKIWVKIAKLVSDSRVFSSTSQMIQNFTLGSNSKSRKLSTILGKFKVRMKLEKISKTEKNSPN